MIRVTNTVVTGNECISCQPPIPPSDIAQCPCTGDDGSAVSVAEAHSIVQNMIQGFIADATSDLQGELERKLVELAG